MVGVPRSGGCHTCRRRRVKCDQERPTCQRCARDKRECDGYERWPVFLNRTTSGIQKRQRLEEAIIPQRSSASSSRRGSATPSLLGEALGQLELRQSSQSPQRRPQQPQDGLLARFLAIYQPASPTERDGSTNTWLAQACHLDQPSPVLRLALHALAANRVAYVDRNNQLTVEGMASYDQALVLLRESLGTPECQEDDQLMAASRCLMIYELFEASTGGFSAWESHERGLVEMATMRGPAGFSSPFAAAILNDIMAMINSIQQAASRSASPFAKEEWRLTDEPTSLREIEQLVFGLGFDLAAIYHEEDEKSGPGDLDLPALERQIKQIDKVSNNLDGALASLAQLRPPVTHDARCQASEFWSLESAVVVATVLALALDASLVVQQMLDRLSRAAILQGFACQDRLQLAPFILSHPPEWHGELGMRIVAAVEHMTREEMGLYGAGRSVFPLRLLLNVLPREEAVFHRAFDLYTQVTARSNIKMMNDQRVPWDGSDDVGGSDSGAGPSGANDGGL